MFKKLIVALVAISTLVACQEKEGSREVVEARTPDGRAFHYMPIWEDGVTDITVYVAWPTAWAHQTGRNQAVPYVASEAILTGGTKDLAPQDVLELFEDRNTYGEILVSADYTYGELSFPKEYTDEVVGIASEMLANPEFETEWMERIKNGFHANQTHAHAQSATKLWNTARLAILGQQPLNEFLSLPNLDDIENVTAQDLRDWHQETFVQGGVTITVTGAISEDDAGKVVDRILSALPERDAAKIQPTTADFSPKTVLLHAPEAEKSVLGILGQLPSTDDGKDTTDLLALHFFSRSGSGPLFEAVRTEMRASYGFNAGYTNYARDTRVLFIAGEVETAKLGAVTDKVLETYEDYRTNPDLTGLDDLRESLASDMDENAEYADIAARMMLELALDGLDPASTPRIGDIVRDIMAKDVAERMLTKYPSSEDLIVFAISPDKDALPGACVITAIEQVLECPPD